MGFRDFINHVKISGKEHGPEIGLVLGSALVAWGFWECRKAAKKEDKILEEHNAKVEEIKAPEIDEETGAELAVTDEDLKAQSRELANEYVNTGVKLVKNYALAGGLAIGGGALVAYSFKVLKKRELAAVASFVTVKSAYDRLVKNLKNEVGIEKARDIINGVHREDIVDVDPATGEVKGVTKDVPVYNPGMACSPWAIVIGPDNPEYHKDPVAMETTLSGKNEMLRRKLFADGYLLLNDVRFYCGEKPTEDGYRLGWVAKDGIGTGAKNFILGIDQIVSPHDRIGDPDVYIVNLYPDGDIFELNKKYDLKLFKRH